MSRMSPRAAVSCCRTRLLVCASIAIGVSGCGGSTGGKVVSAILAPYHAIAAHDAAAFCDAFTSSARDSIAHSVAKARNCISVVGTVLDRGGDLSMWRTLSEQIKITNITTRRGGVGTVMVSYPHGPRTRVTVERDHGVWRIATQPIVADVDTCFALKRHAGCITGQRLWFFVGDHTAYIPRLSTANRDIGR